jgi:hypothetical protein
VGELAPRDAADEVCLGLGVAGRPAQEDPRVGDQRPLAAHDGDGGVLAQVRTRAAQHLGQRITRGAHRRAQLGRDAVVEPGQARQDHRHGQHHRHSPWPRLGQLPPQRAARQEHGEYHQVEEVVGEGAGVRQDEHGQAQRDHEGHLLHVQPAAHHDGVAELVDHHRHEGPAHQAGLHPQVLELTDHAAGTTGVARQARAGQPQDVLGEAAVGQQLHAHEARREREQRRGGERGEGAAWLAQRHQAHRQACPARAELAEHRQRGQQAGAGIVSWARALARHQVHRGELEDHGQNVAAKRAQAVDAGRAQRDEHHQRERVCPRHAGPVERPRHLRQEHHHHEQSGGLGGHVGVGEQRPGRGEHRHTQRHKACAGEGLAVEGRRIPVALQGALREP